MRDVQVNHQEVWQPPSPPPAFENTGYFRRYADRSIKGSLIARLLATYADIYP
jgi:hypothetical protein